MNDYNEHTFYLNLGSNLGDRETNLWAADLRLSLDLGLVTARSEIYESEPWGFESDNGFLNMAIAVECRYSPSEALDIIHAIERELSGGASHRDSRGRYIDRMIDIDIMAIDDLVIDTPKLKVPHRHLMDRDFFRIPFSQIAPDWRHPVTGEPLQK